MLRGWAGAALNLGVSCFCYWKEREPTEGLTRTHKKRPLSAMLLGPYDL